MDVRIIHESLHLGTNFEDFIKAMSELIIKKKMNINLAENLYPPKILVSFKFTKNVQRLFVNYE